MDVTSDDDHGQLLVVTLSREMMADHVSEILALDSDAIRHMGRKYAPGAWNAENFLMDRPHKWQLSTAVMKEGRVVGFWIVATIHRPWAFVFRVAFDAAVRGQGVARDSFNVMRRRIVDQGDALGISRLALEVSMDNGAARCVYERLGFKTVRGDDLRRFVEAVTGRRSLVLEVLDDHFVTGDGGCEMVMALDLACQKA